MDIKENFSLKDVCTFRIGGNAKYFIKVSNNNELIESIEFAKKVSSPIFVYGGGSNLLFPDTGLEAVVIRVLGSQISSPDNQTIKVSAGTLWPQLERYCSQNSLYGLEAFSGLPGTLGGAVYGNAGAHGVEMKDIITSVQVFDIKDSKIKDLSVAEIDFGYRYSSFKQSNQYIILEVNLKVSTDPKDNTGNPIEFSEFRKLNQPQGLTTGSFFKNPEGNYAGKLIEEAGLKGFQMGGITTSPKHANFFINLGDGTAKDVLSLKEHIVATVKQKFGIELVPEVQIIDSTRLIHLS
jgi:UDP-N-acetylmuramate dehydrogenase